MANFANLSTDCVNVATQCIVNNNKYKYIFLYLKDVLLSLDLLILTENEKFAGVT